jgi:hypothetical protein
VDPVTLIVSALAAGASAAFKSTAESAVKDAYEGLKKLLFGRYKDIDVAPVEKKPESEAKRQSLAEDLEAAGATGDDELREAAQRLIEAVRAHDASAGAAVGVDLEQVEAEFLKISDVSSTGTGVRVRHGTFTGGIDISGVDAGGGEAPPTRP